MKIVLVTTTINVPRVLALYAKYGPDVQMIVIGDRKSPDSKIVEFLEQNCPNHLYLGIDAQKGFKVDKLLGENTIGRRNVGYVLALEAKADVIVTVDDDNAPLSTDYFRQMVLGPATSSLALFDGLEASASSRWFDVGQFYAPVAPHRGFPYTRKCPAVLMPVTDARIGVVAGCCLGDPDIDAATRIVNGPTVHRVSEVLQDGIVVASDTWTVFNSQNTAFLRELTPAMFLAPGVGRHDDIFASLICQRIMRECGLQVFHGKPFVWQQRNEHNLLGDLDNEIYGMKTIERLAKYLDTITFRTNTVIEQVRELWQGFDSLPNSYEIMPKHAVATALAFLEDCEKTL